MSKRRNRKKVSPTHSAGILATKERQLQNGGVVVEIIHEQEDGKIYIRRHRAKFASVLDSYLWQERINKPEHNAGDKFGREYARSVLRIKVYEGTGNHGDHEMLLISAINGNKVLREAFDILSSAQQGILISVCAYNNRAGDGRKINFLKATLGILAKHWKML